MKITHVLLICLLASSFLQSQNLSQIGQQKPIDFSGRLSVGLSYYETTRDRPSFSPFSYSINASPTLSLYGISIPFNIIYSEKQRSFRQSYNKLGASPEYKWVKLHIGQRNVNFNPYTLAGKTFLGYGIELNPGIIRVGFIKGKFNREVRNVEGIDSYIQPSFGRTGWAARVGIGNNRNKIDISVLRAIDDIPENFNPIEFGSVRAAENLAVGLQMQAQIVKQLSASINIAGSAYSEDISSREVDVDSSEIMLPENVFTPRLNSTLKFAGDINLRYSNPKFSISGGYKRIEPDYKSLGAYRFLTDIVDYTVSPSFVLFNRSTRVSGTYGIQNNNITGLRLQTSYRTIGSININYQTSNALSANLNYNNYKTDVISIDEEILSDSFDIIQVSENINFRFQLPIGNNKSNSISLYAGQQVFNRELMINEFDVENISRNVNLSWNHRQKEGFLGYSVRINAARIVGQNSRDRVGARIGIKKRFAKKARISLNTGVFQNFTNGLKNGISLNSSLRSSYRITEKQSIKFTFRILSRNAQNSDSKEYNDYRSQLNYSVSF